MKHQKNDIITPENVCLTQYSHGAGCGCKISPKVLQNILAQTKTEVIDPKLLVGNGTLDDAAVYAIDDEKVLISTTDFFMPIVDNPLDFGGIASVNAISDIYAMGGQPLMAVAILVWPVNTLSEEIAGQVLEGAKRACAQAGIAIAGGHSIDGPEPIFGLAVTGIASRDQVKKNSSATAGCELFLTKALGVGILSTAQKKGLLKPEDLDTARNSMLTLNKIGQDLGKLSGVKAMTDVTGFGLLGHLVELCEGSDLSARIQTNKVPTISGLDYYMEHKTFPGGTFRNFDSYGHKVSPLSDDQKHLLCDPQTSGGLLVAVDPAEREAFMEIAGQYNLELESFGVLEAAGEHVVNVEE
ncbi:MAG: selenide, water dikinase SelD [Marinilabiliaceae bacterium]|nr:selenide, water dikinase SelD [Marinilabiliaceae bacterium]